MQAGVFVGAEGLSANVCSGVFTHFKREEGETLVSGKLDEELSRMSEIADCIASQSMLLCNESFAATNEREGSQIAREVVRAMLDGGVKVLFVTHLFDLADRLRREGLEAALFLSQAARRCLRATVAGLLPQELATLEQELAQRLIAS